MLRGYYDVYWGGRLDPKNTHTASRHPLYTLVYGSLSHFNSQFR